MKQFDYNYFEEIEIDLTGVCNLQCDRCTRNYKHSQHLVKKNVRPLDEITQQLDKFKNLKILMLAGQVSEPTLYPNFIDLVKYAKERNIKINLFTNASILREDLFENLKNILDKNDTVHFTICGTNQELHKKYRAGSKLDIILKNAKSFINSNKNDYLQYIRFTYNNDDSILFKELMESRSGSVFNIFNNYYIVESEGDRLFNETIKPRLSTPCKDKFYKNIFNELNKIKVFKPKCKSIEWKKIYIDQFGKIYPCYSFAEYNNIDFNLDTVYDKILSGYFDCCKLCSNTCNQLMKRYGLDFVC